MRYEGFMINHIRYILKCHIDLIFYVHTLGAYVRFHINYEVFIIKPVARTSNNDNTPRTIYDCMGSLAFMTNPLDVYSSVENYASPADNFRLNAVGRNVFRSWKNV